MARILIVEDEETVRRLLARALGQEGHQVEVAEDGLDGLELLRAEGGAYDLVLSDIRMPAMDGIAMAEAAGQIHPELPVLFMTGYAEQRERAAEASDNVVGVLDKPFTLGDMRERVREVLAVRC